MEVPQLEKIPDEYELQFEASTATATGLWSIAAWIEAVEALICLYCLIGAF